MAIRLGKVYLVGAGPGDPDLLTLKGKKCLEQAHAILYDQLVSDDLLKLAAESAELIYVGKQGGKHCADQRAIEELLIRKAREGKTVVRLKGGDPFVFGRGGEEAAALKRPVFPMKSSPESVRRLLPRLTPVFRSPIAPVRLALLS